MCLYSFLSFTHHNIIQRFPFDEGSERVTRADPHSTSLRVRSHREQTVFHLLFTNMLMFLEAAEEKP